jgi:hypothetical protein
MKILIDIGHPAHVHYFRNFIKVMEEKKHQICVISRDKEVSQILLDAYNIPYISRGKGGNGLLGKITYLFKANTIVFKEALKFKPDIFLSFASPYAAQVAWLLRKPHIAFTDTEHAKLGNYAFMPFSTKIITPDSFETDLGEKHIKFKGFMEQAYLDDKYFTPNPVNDLLDLKNNEKYILLRFVSWGASHDIGHSGLNDKTKKELIDELSKNYRVLISSEAGLPQEFEKYKIKISPDRMHDVLANAELFIGEGATMASECAMLGTPAIYVNSLNAGTLKAQEASGSIFGFRNSDGVLEKVQELLSTKDLKEKFKKKRAVLLDKTVDVNNFIVEQIEKQVSRD